MKHEHIVHLHLHRSEPEDRVILDTLDKILTSITTQGKKIMATLNELRDELTAIKTAVDAGKITAQEQIDLIAALKKQIEEGSPVTQQQLDELDAQADGILAALQPGA